MTTVSIIEFILLLLIAASLVALVSNKLKIPYTIALVICGFLMDLLHVPIKAMFEEGSGPEQILTPEIIFVLFLPALLFEAGLNIHIRHLRENLAPITLLAVVGVLAASMITGLAVFWGIGLPLMVALTFGALIAATDPISVLALFKDMGVNKRLSVIVEAESLFNDGVAVVIFQILVAGVATGSLSVTTGIGRFLIASLGGGAIGLVLGYAFSKITERVDDPRIEITLTTILAYGSYLLAEQVHVSGVIAVVAAGLMVGNFGAEVGMSARTRVALWTFWEYLAFVINSIVFLLIGIEVHLFDILDAWQAIILSIGAVLLGRMVVVYGLTPLANRFTKKIPLSWQHVLVWGGLHGSVSMALALSLAPDFPYRTKVLAMTYGVVAFSLVVQGLTVKPLIHLLGIKGSKENEYDIAKVRQISFHAAKQELEDLFGAHLISKPVYREISKDLEAHMKEADQEIAQLHARDRALASEEHHMAQKRMIQAEKHAIQRAAGDGLITAATAEEMVADADERLEELRRSVD